MKRLGAFPVYLVYSGASSLFFAVVFTVSGVYKVNAVGLNPLQLVLVGTLLETVCFLFEVPTGVVADVYSRRLSVIIGVVLIGLGFIVEGSIPLFWAVLLAQVFWGIGATFTSGADGAWIADEVGEDNVKDAYLRGAQAGQIGGLIGIAISVALAGINLGLAIVVGGGLFIALGLFLAWFMPEDGFVPAQKEELSSWGQMVDTLQNGLKEVKKQPILMTVLAISAVWGLSSEGFDRLWELNFLSRFAFPELGGLEPVTWFGIFGAGSMVLSLVATEIVKRTVRTDVPAVLAKILVGINMLLVIAVVGFGAAGNFTLALAAYWATCLLKAVTGPIHDAWVNRYIPSRVRATILSTSAQANALGQIVGGPIVGAIASATTVGIGIVVTGIIISPVVLLYSLAVRQSGEQNTRRPAPVSSN